MGKNMLCVVGLEASLSVWAIILLLLWGMCCVGPAYWMKPFERSNTAKQGQSCSTNNCKCSSDMWSNPSHQTAFIQPCRSTQWHCVRAVKEMDSKSIGLCPQGFESPRCRFVCMSHDRQLQRNWDTCKLDQPVEFYMPRNRCLGHQTSKALRLNWRALTTTKHSQFNTFRLATLTALNDDLETYLR